MPSCTPARWLLSFVGQVKSDLDLVSVVRACVAVHIVYMEHTRHARLQLVGHGLLSYMALWWRNVRCKSEQLLLG